MLIDTLRKDLMNAMKEKNQNTKDVLQIVIAGFTNKRIEKRADLTEQDEIEVLAKEVKQIKETISLTPADRTEMIRNNKYKISVLERYLPVQLSEAEIKVLVNSVILKLGIGGNSKPSDMGKVMKELIPQTKGKCDGGLVSSIVKEALQKKALQ